MVNKVSRNNSGVVVRRCSTCSFGKNVGGMILCRRTGKLVPSAFRCLLYKLF